MRRSLGLRQWGKRNTSPLKSTEIPEVVKVSGTNKKNTKKWCRGKVGVSHAIEWILDPKHPTWNWYIYQCQKCLKQFDYCFYSPILTRQNDCKCGFHNLPKESSNQPR